MERLKFRPETKRKLGFSATIAASLALAACSGNFPGYKVLNTEISHGIAQDGRIFTPIIIEGQTEADSNELEANGGANVSVGFIGEGPTNVTTAGIIPEGTRINNAVVFDAGHGQKSAAFSCASVAGDLFYDWKYMDPDKLQQITCYILVFDRFGTAVEPKTLK